MNTQAPSLAAGRRSCLHSPLRPRGSGVGRRLTPGRGSGRFSRRPGGVPPSPPPAASSPSRPHSRSRSLPGPGPGCASPAGTVRRRAARMQAPHKEHLYKLLVIGDLGVGKTSIIKRYVHQNFSSHYRATIGVDFALKVLQWDPETVVRLQLWDIAGQERFGNMTRVYYREAMGAFIVFDVTRPATFEAVTKWKNDLDSKLSLPNGKPVSVVLLANKCDQGKDVLMNNGLKMDQFCKEHGFVGWFETSAKENINIDEASRCLVKHILANECDLMESIEPDIVKPRLTSSKVVSCSSCAKS
ncbi:ras-related protein Rab-38 [Equus caballus]|uniref:ras-related protein Rab-38 n=1 Tax=Equus caballus TaxID=9796 RepID=UPI0038B39F5A